MFGIIKKIDEKRKERKEERKFEKKSNLDEMYKRFEKEVAEYELNFDPVSDDAPARELKYLQDKEEKTEDAEKDEKSESASDDAPSKELKNSSKSDKKKSATEECEECKKISKKLSSVLDKVPDIDKDKTFINKDMKTGVITLDLVTKKGETRSYRVDDGSLLGGTGISILFNTNGNDDFFIPATKEYEDIIVRGLSGNDITPQDVQRVRKNFFANLMLYAGFDFSNTEKIDEIKKNEDSFSKLNNILSTIFENNLLNVGNNLDEVPRFRFENFKDYNNFTVVSDDKVKPGLQNDHNKALVKTDKTKKYIVNERGIFYYVNDVCTHSHLFLPAPQNVESPMTIVTPMNQYIAMPNPYFQQVAAI